MRKFIAYKRVSTSKQEDSGLGLGAQQATIDRYVSSNGEIVETFKETESGTKGSRPELDKALHLCKTNGYVLIVAKLDRLYRNVEFTAKLLNSKIEFVCCDFPQANKLTITILAAIAEHEADITSKRTKEALAIKKKQGIKLGNPGNLSDKARKAGAEAMKQKSRVENKQVIALIISKKENGLTYDQIAMEANHLGFLSTRGNLFSAKTIRDLHIKNN